MTDYYIMSLKWTRHNEDSVTWWGPNNSGYTWVLANAGRYTEDQVRGNLSYYDNRDSTIAIPCKVAERAASTVVLREAAREMLTEVLGKPAILVGTVVDDKDYKGREECSSCMHCYGNPGPARIVVDSKAS